MKENRFESLELKCAQDILGELAYIDDKDIVEDFLTDDIFQSNRYSSDRNQHLGFIAGYPTIADTRLDGVKISLLRPSEFSMDGVSLWRAEVMENLVGIRTAELGTIYYLNDETQLIYAFEVSDSRIRLRIFHVK